MLINPGDVISVTTASGSTAVIVWACTEQEYREAVADGVKLDSVDGIPWPLSAIVEVTVDAAKTDAGQS